MYLLYFFLFILGLVFGSFINVVIDRLPSGESLIKGRSHCDSCKKRISIFDLIPVLSYILLRGRCRNCKKEIPLRVLLVEILSGVVFVLLFLFTFTTIAAYILLCAITLTLIAVAVIDMEHGIIADALLIVLGLFSLGYIFISNPSALPSHFLTALVSFSFLFVVFGITRGRGIGFGDVKFAFFMGFLLGALPTILAFYIAFLTGAFFSIILVIGRKKKFKGSSIPFGPFLSLGVLTALIFGNQILELVRPYIGI